MRPSGSISIGRTIACSIILASLAGCAGVAWRKVQVGRTTGPEVGAIFKTTVGPKDRYAYALSEDKLSGNKTLIMVSLDNAGVARSKYYWHSVPRPMIFGVFGTDSWEISLETQIAVSQLQEHRPTAGPREQAILEYFGRLLFDASRQFEHLNEVSGITDAMNRILAIAINQYGRQTEKQTLPAGKGFAFDSGSYGNKCSMKLAVVDEGRGLYSLVLKGYRTNGFFSGK